MRHNRSTGILTPRLHVATLLIAGLAWCSHALGGVFDVGSKPSESATVTVESLAQSIDSPTSPMLDQLSGLLAHLDKAQCLELRASGAGATLMEIPDGSTHLCVIHLKAGAVIHNVEIVRTPDGLYLANDLEAAQNPKFKPKAAKVRQDKFAKLAAQWPAFRGEFSTPKAFPAPGKAGELPHPHTPGWILLDNDTLGERLFGGKRSTWKPTGRKLDEEPFLVRLPKGFDPKEAHGVLVYVGPGTQSTLPPPFFDAADELGLIMVGAVRTGNTVHGPDREQMALDAVATIAERCLVDRRRVYITGISGGGQISTIMWACFPDVFTGAVPIVALGSYVDIPLGNNTMWQRKFERPRPEFFKLAKQHRMAAITGNQDMNQRSMEAAAAIYKKDGFTLRFDDYPDMGHECPTAARFADALRWVDAPYRDTRAAEVKAADEALEKAIGLKGGDAALRRASLVEVTRAGPWTPAAWKAVALLEGKPKDVKKP